ncbi:MAG: hypothetical protein K1X72_00700 [Pyrinomonadaceae bacterium]|nr:hypothetical protein [Pyrinomonadaceae bacterium]
MKRFGLRILVGLIAFAIGVGVVALKFSKSNITDFVLEKKSIPIFTSEASNSGQVEIYFRGFFKNENFAEFEVINGTSKNIYYQGSTRGHNPFSSVSLSGKESEYYGNWGFVVVNKEEFVIEPSETVRFKLWANRFREFSAKQKRQDFRVGFDLRFDGKENYETVWSNEFQLPKWVKRF